jgi:hypothetical protein
MGKRGTHVRYLCFMQYVDCRETLEVQFLLPTVNLRKDSNSVDI